MNPPDLTTYLSLPSPVERELCRLFSPNSSPLIFDVGSCEGEESIRYSNLFPRAYILAFEPLPANQQLIRANFERHAVANAELIPLALSDRSGEATFHVSGGQPPGTVKPGWNYGNKSSSLLPPASSEPMYGWLKFERTITVPTVTLSSFCAQRGYHAIDFIHMDVQGAERQVLLGAGDMLARTTAVWLEVADRALYHGQVLRGEIERLMHDSGFALAHEVRREVEGDQFYVNRRRARTWPYLAANRLQHITARARAFGRRWRSHAS